METKLDKLIKLIKAQDWQKALSMAAKFPRLGKHRDQIVKGHEAYNFGKTYKQLGYDPDQLIQDGIKALKERYGKYL